MSAPIRYSYFAGVYDVGENQLRYWISSGRLKDLALWCDADHWPEPYVVVWSGVFRDSGCLVSGDMGTWSDYSSLSRAKSSVSEFCHMDSEFLTVYHYEIWHVVPDQRLMYGVDDDSYLGVKSRVWLVGVSPANDVAPMRLVSDFREGNWLYEPYKRTACCICDDGKLAWILLDCSKDVSRAVLHNDILYYLYHACACYDGFCLMSEYTSLNREIVSLSVDGGYESGVGSLRNNARRTTCVVTSDDRLLRKVGGVR